MILCSLNSIAQAADFLEPGFQISVFAEGLDEPTAIEFAPDGRLFIAEKAGRIWLIENGAMQAAPVFTLEVNNFLESGLLGMCLDPDFSTNHYIYVFATISNDEQQIIRFTENSGIGEDPVVIKQSLPSLGTFHNGGGLRIGPDGKLYFSVGDNTSGANAQDMTTLAGKICRINLDGSTPADNPFATPTGTPRAIFAFGFRNPFRFCFAPDGRLFACDVGSNGEERQEEINLVAAGDNGGWPDVEGFSDDESASSLIDPIYTYHDEGAAPTGIIYYTGESFPAEYAGNLFHLEYTLNKVFRVVLDGDAVLSHTLFADLDGGPVDLTKGPDGSLFYTELISGRIMRITYGEPEDIETITPPETPSDFCGLGTTFALTTMTLMLAPLIVRRRCCNSRNDS